MKLALQGNVLHIRELSDSQYQIIRSWGRFKWNKTLRELSGLADLDTLDRLSKMVILPAPIAEYHKSLKDVQNAVDDMRMAKTEEVKPLIKPPIKEGIKPYAHQTRAYNMALITFGVVAPSEITQSEEINHGNN